MVNLTYQEVGANVQERFAVQHFVHALSEKEDRLHLRRYKSKSLDKALELAQDLECPALVDNNNSIKKSTTKDCKVRKIVADLLELKDEIFDLKIVVDKTTTTGTSSNYRETQRSPQNGRRFPAKCN